jgi:hypothetical protein
MPYGHINTCESSKERNTYDDRRDDVHEHKGHWLLSEYSAED